MKRAWLAALLALPLFGCSTWQSAGKSQEQWYSDFHECAAVGERVADYANGYVRGGIGIEFRLYPDVRPTLFRPFGKRIRENCMEELGWSKRAKESE